MKIKNKNSKKVMLVTAMLIFIAFLAFFVPNISAATPTIAYSSISDDEQFVDVVNGIGVNLTVCVDDSDSNLQSVNIHTNATGSWVSIYGSGALGGVASHNTSQFVVDDWLDSWTTYYFRITANDGGDTLFYYSFTTEYVFGDWQLLVSDVYENYAPNIYKNDTGDYWMLYSEGASRNTINYLQSTNGVDWVIQNTFQSNSGGGGAKPPTLNVNIVKYDNNIYTYSQTSSSYTIGCFNGVDWSYTTTNIRNYNSAGSYGGETSHGYGNGAHMIYFNGNWYAFISEGTTSGWMSNGHAYSRAHSYLRFCSIDNPTDTSLTTLETISSIQSGTSGEVYGFFCNAHFVYNGTLYIFYRLSGSNHIYYKTYDGISLSSQQSLGFNDLFTFTYTVDVRDDIGGMGATVDYTNDQVVLSYVDTNENMVYRVFDGTSWTDKHVIADISSGYDGDIIQHCEPRYIDGRIIVTFSSDAFADNSYCIYSVSAPSYSDIIGGASEKLSKFSWADASPGDTNINSSVFEIVNMNDRDILNITWHVGNIGDITSASNAKMWTNMSGLWVSYQVGADQNISTIDISAVKGSEWLPAEKTYWKIEIETIDAGITETTHIADYNIYYWIDLEAI